MISLYQRVKVPDKGWRYQRIHTGRGKKTGGLKPPFFVRPTRKAPDGKTQNWIRLDEQYEEAVEAAAKLEQAAEAESKGLTVGELGTDANRILIRSAVEEFLNGKRKKSRRTVVSYAGHLNSLLESLPKSVRFVDQLTSNVLTKCDDLWASEGSEPRTRYNRLLTVAIFLNKLGIKNPVSKDERPVYETELPVAYTDEELKALFAAMDEEENVRYRFFLGSACREQEVTYLSWADIDFEKCDVHVRAKPEVGFTIKNHESRTVPLPKSLIALLRERRKDPPNPRWVFVNEDGLPEKHFLRKLKRIAHRAELNCGNCRTTVTKGRYERKYKVEVCCETDPVCEHWTLHRFRKTCATRWSHHNIPVRTIQGWLGHKSLETTQKYLGTDSGKHRGQVDEAFGD